MEALISATRAMWWCAWSCLPVGDAVAVHMPVPLPEEEELISNNTLH